MSWRNITTVALVLLLAAQGAQAATRVGGFPYTVNTSARFSGFGGAGVAAPWGNATNNWANPAQLAYRQGLHWESFHMQIAQGLADDIKLESNELIFGLDGIALVFGYWPMNGLYLDMGDQEGVDENGNPTGFFHSYIQSRSLGLAVDAVRLVDRFLIKPESEFQLQRWLSCSIGYVRKGYHNELSSDQVVQDPTGGDGAEAKTYDLGFLLSATPVNTLAGDGDLGFLLGVAYGFSTLNGGDETIKFPLADQSSVFPRAHVKGWSVHGEAAVNREAWRRNFTGTMASLYETFNPLISLTYSYQKSQRGYLWDGETNRYVYEHDKSGLYDKIGKGWELGLGNIFYLRRGIFEDHRGEVDTEGWGINIQAGPYGGVHYDKAKVQVINTGLQSEDRETWLLWVDPSIFWRD